MSSSSSAAAAANDQQEEEDLIIDPPSPPNLLLAGKDVMICNLQSKPEYNGMIARCIEWYPSKQRYSVKTHRGSAGQQEVMLLLKPSCIQEIDAPASNAAADGADAAAADVAVTASCVERLSLESSLESLLDPRDDLDKAIRYVKKGRLHAESFAKKLFHTSERIRDGQIDPCQLADNLINILVEREHQQKDHPNIILVSDGGLPFSDLVEEYNYFGYYLASYAIPPGWFGDNDSAPGSAPALATGGSGMHGNDLRKKVCLELSQTIAHNMLEDSKKIGPRNIDMERSFRKSCVECANMIDEVVFNGKKGCFIRTCLLLVDGNQYAVVHNKCTEQYSKFNTLEQNLKIAVQDIGRGSHEPDRVCWQCHTPMVETNTNTPSCGGCNLASYCSRECHTKAWKEGGHNKQKCARVLSEYQALEETCTIIESFHSDESRPREQGLRGIASLNFDADCNLAVTAHVNSFVHPFTFGKPSGVVFYKNLGKVLRGEWWMWPSNETESLAKYKAKLKNQSDEDYYKLLSSALFFDWCCRRDGCTTFWIPFAQNGCGINVPMPVERFLEIYQSNAGLHDSPKERSLLFRRVKCEVKQQIRENLQITNSEVPL